MWYVIQVGGGKERSACRLIERFVPEDLMKYKGTCHFSNSEIFSLIEKFAAEKADGERKILYIWGHTYEFDVMKKGDHIRRVFDALKGTGAQFVCNREAFRV